MIYTVHRSFTGILNPHYKNHPVKSFLPIRKKGRKRSYIEPYVYTIDLVIVDRTWYSIIILIIKGHNFPWITEVPGRYGSVIS